MKYKNNPLNVRATSSNWIGKTGEKNGFLEFDCVAHGVRCAIYLLKRTYKRWFGYVSLSQAIGIFAPPSENDTMNYVKYVVEQSGVGADRLIWFCTTDEWYRILKAMCKMESGYCLSYKTFLEAYGKV